MTAVYGAPPDPGTKPQYPFAEWLDGRWWTLTRGRDFWGPVDRFIASLEASARARRVKIDIVLIENGGRNVKIRAVPRGQDDAS